MRVYENNCYWYVSNSFKRFGKKTGRIKNQRKSLQARIGWFVSVSNYHQNITPREFFITGLTDDLSRESEREQIFSSLQDS